MVKPVNQIKWTRNARKRLKEIKLYFEENVNDNVADKIVLQITSAVFRLYDNPNLGMRELTLCNSSIVYRYLVEGNYKIIYKQRGTVIYILTVFDCRQSPDKLFEDIPLK
ncbi:MAG: type II toxin-antitoxin system RelE/ParE family toxin [Parabacteroides gordonii]|nr:type II toxin-antitoxin system RelE/ParE family toxin [Parabacteroides gordonii]